MGDYVNFNEQFTNTNGSYQIDYYVTPKNLEKAKKYYAQTKDILTVFEKNFGEYPFKRDGVGMVEAPFEGMEH
jgi:aminopeptidase N